MRADSYPRLRGGAQLFFEGFNQNRLLSELMKSGCKAYEIERLSASGMRLKVTDKYLPLCLSVAEKLGFTVTRERKLGALSALVSLLPRLGIPITLAVLTVCYALSCGFIWRVEISGNERVDPYTIERVLKDDGASRGCKKSAVDTQAAEKALRELDGIAEATVEIRGNTLKVSVLESLDYVSEGGGAPVIYSDYDAQITRITVLNGTALVKTGERIFKGEALISGQRIGTDGQLLEEGLASGEVYGKVVLTESVNVTLTGKTLMPTGRKKRSTLLSLFGLKIGKRKDGFEYAKVTEKQNKLCLLPIAVTSVTAEELEMTDYEMTKEEAVRAATEKARQKLDERMSARAEEETVEIYELGGGVICVKLYRTVEIKIGEA